MKLLCVLLPVATLAACAPSGTDSRTIARSYLSSYTNNVAKPPVRAFYNGHPSAEIRVTYEISRPGSAVVRKSTDVKAYENRVVAKASEGEVKVIETDFTDPFHQLR